MRYLTILLASLACACGSNATHDDAAADAVAGVDTAPAEPCPGYAGARSCCALGDPCGLAGDRVCDCDGACAWDQADCALRCAADGVCVMECPADPDCATATPCACDHAHALCETAAACSADPCACDPDCADTGPCSADGTCDPRCPKDADPDCAGLPDDGKTCCAPACAGKVCGDDGCGGSCGDCPADYACTNGRCLVDQGCGVIDDWGCCQGTVAVWCDTDGTLVQVDCADNDPPEPCGWDVDSGYYCGGSGVDPTGITSATCIYEPCTPACVGRECGTDGCNGSCGDCTEGEVCRNGSCRPE